MPPKRKASLSPPPSSQIFCSAPIDDRKSTFIAHYSPTLPAKTLQANPDFVSASHRAAAWRFPSKQRVLSSNIQSSQQLFDTGCDDDGEQYAGKRLEKVLDTMKVEGAVVVARWYGGILLGPVRFTHIETCARDAILRSRAGNDGSVRSYKEQKRGEEVESAKKEKLEGILRQRDKSITALRVLLAEKKANGLNATQSSPSPKPPLYELLPLSALAKLEKARDATIAFLLKEIDKAERANVPDEIAENVDRVETDGVETDGAKTPSRHETNNVSREHSPQ